MDIYCDIVFHYYYFYIFYPQFITPKCFISPSIHFFFVIFSYIVPSLLSLWVNKMLFYYYIVFCYFAVDTLYCFKYSVYCRLLFYFIAWHNIMYMISFSFHCFSKLIVIQCKLTTLYNIVKGLGWFALCMFLYNDLCELLGFNVFEEFSWISLQFWENYI